MHEAWRLTFVYDGDEYRLRSIRKLDKRLPSRQDAGTERSMRTVEVRGREKAVLFRGGIDHLTPETMEHPTGDPARPFGRVRVPGPREVSVLVPHLPEALSVAIVERVAPAATGKRGRAAEPTRRDMLVVDLPRGEDAR